MLLNLLFASATLQFDLPPGLLSSVCFVESQHNVASIHKHDGQGDSLGICQVKHETAKWLGFKGTARQLMVPETNVYYAAKYLAYQIDRYDDVTRAIVAYNRGNATQLIRSTYSDKVLKQWRMNERRYQVCLK